MKVTEIVEEISPAIAAIYLEKNINGDYKNRDLRPASVIKWYNVMKKNEWAIDVNPIIFDSNGSMIDGQHRLLAIIRLGRPVRMAVKRGVNPKSFKALDQNESRNAVDFADIERRPETKKSIPVFRWIYNQQVCKSPTITPKVEFRISEYELQEWGYENHSAVIDAVIWVRENHGKGVGIPERVMTYLAYNFFKLDRNLGEEYLKYLTHMDSNTKYGTFSMIKLRTIKYLQTARANNTTGRSINEWIMSNTISAWNAVREGKQNLTKFKVQPDTCTGSYDIY